jgi:RsiW-degrading membrane proteinase PrsW (M82 family)
LRHLHWLLVLALLPLAFSLLDSENRPTDLGTRLGDTLEQAPPETQLRIARVLAEIEQGQGSLEALFTVLPDQKFVGAWLPRNSGVHWAFAAGSAILFMVFFLLLASHGTAEPLHLLGIGLFTATIGIALLLLFQVLADWSQGGWFIGRSILVIVFYVVKLIGWSYRAALDPENGFFLSFLGFTLGVGLCEEVCKALPLFWHYRRPSAQSWRTAFVWGLTSGAGFGIAEGIMYAGRYYNGIAGPGSYVVRFMSCVALHALWTGSVGITLNQQQQLIRNRGPWYEYVAPIVFIVSVPMVLHGLYDTLLKKEMNALALIVAALSFLWLAFQISRLHTVDDQAAKEALLHEYQRRRAVMS